MTNKRASKFCKICDKKTLHEQPEFSVGFGCLLTIITGGLFLIIWIFFKFFSAFRGFRCLQCGTRRY